MESSRPAAAPTQDAAAAASGHAQPQHIDDLSVQWDQTYLRLNYILGNLGGPVAADNNSSFSSASAKTGAEGGAAAAGGRGAAAAAGGGGGASSSATPGRRNSLGNGAGDRVSKSAIPNFPALSRPDAARKVAQIATWRDEVVSHADDVLCGCSLGSCAAISAADEAPSNSVTKGLLPAAFVAGSLASPAVRSRRKASLVAAAAAISRDDDGSGMNSSSSSGDDADSPVDSLCALCGRHGDVRDLVAESWPGDGGAARKALRRMQLGLLRIGRRRQLLPRGEEPFPPDADPKTSHNNIQSHNHSAAAAATSPRDLKPAAIATTSMYHYRTDPDDQDDEDLSSDDSTSTGSRNGIKSKPGGCGGASKTLTAREQMERSQRAKDARLRRAQKLLEKSLVVTPKTTGVQS
ncbi:hypothetical protein PspLS_08558 [Pyricularia sp. CBS 133598]|nr:hypothetical protein PspLS_08558 [Pyricularia sp. CBS 133598]